MPRGSEISFIFSFFSLRSRNRGVSFGSLNSKKSAFHRAAQFVGSPCRARKRRNRSLKGLGGEERERDCRLSPHSRYLWRLLMRGMWLRERTRNRCNDCYTCAANAFVVRLLTFSYNNNPRIKIIYSTLTIIKQVSKNKEFQIANNSYRKVTLKKRRIPFHPSLLFETLPIAYN